MNYKVTPISKTIADSVREMMVSPHGNLPALSSIADGYGPCRCCLRFFKQGEEERIYISYDPFVGNSNLPLPGPVFIHAEDCDEYSEEIFPKHLLGIPLIFEAYGDHIRLAASEVVDRGGYNEQIDKILAMPDVNSIHLRNGEAGCFIAKILRA